MSLQTLLWNLTAGLAATAPGTPIYTDEVQKNFAIHTNLFYISEVVKEFHLVFGTVWREAIESQKTIQLSRVVQRVGNKHWCLDEGEHVLRAFCIQHDIIQIKRSLL